MSNSMNVCYGRFLVPHRGHELLFAKSTHVICSKSPSEHHSTTLAQYSERPVINLYVGTLLNWLEQKADSDVRVVLGEDNFRLAQLCVQLGHETLIVPRAASSISSTKVRSEFAKGRTPAQLAGICFSTVQKANLEYAMWRAGY